MPIANLRKRGEVGGGGGYLRVMSAVFDGDTAYPTGGYTFDAAALNRLNIGSVADCVPGRPAGANIDIAYNDANVSLQFFVSSTGAEVANGVDVSAFTKIPLLIFGG